MRARIFLGAVVFGVSGLFSATASAADTGPVKVTFEPVRLAAFQPQRKVFGKLTWKGGFRLTSSDPRFGGFSGLALSKNGTRFVAVSDRGWWLKGQLLVKNGNLRGAKALSMAPLRIDTRRESAYWRDSETITPWNALGIDGKLLVGFERRTRILSYDFKRRGFAARPLQLRIPPDIRSGPFNKELEAIGRFYSGPRKNWLIAISERNLNKNGDLKAWLWHRKRTIAFAVKHFEDYEVTDLAVLPDGKSFVTLERSFNLPNLPGFAVRKFETSTLKKGATITGKLLFSGRQPFFSIDNMEGIAVHKTTKGKTQITMISDDNYRRSIQSTLVFRFEISQ